MHRLLIYYYKMLYSKSYVNIDLMLLFTEVPIRLSLQNIVMSYEDS